MTGLSEALSTQSGAGPVDVTSWVGSYPFRDVPHPDPEVLVRVLEREGFSGAWVGSLPGAFHRDPLPSNRTLLTALAPYRERLQPALIVRPDWPDWQSTLKMAIDEGSPAVRVYPAQWGYGQGTAALVELAHACGEAGLVMHLTVRFEDLRQRHPIDVAGDVGAAAIRAIARAPGSRCRLLVAGAGRDLIEEVHWGLTPAEQSRVWYDFSWVWGPPEDHFAHLVESLGPQRLALSSWWPLRLAQQSRSLVDLLPPAARKRAEATAFADGRSIRATGAHS
jgi:hypothetical protein